MNLRESMKRIKLSGQFVGYVLLSGVVLYAAYTIATIKQTPNPHIGDYLEAIDSDETTTTKYKTVVIETFDPEQSTRVLDDGLTKKVTETFYYDPRED